ncbi:MAG: peptidylprolyl isomerase [Phycisphaerales bacterium]|nr:peptidylprolyl isomerase [Phycisphaerales bacterium]
MTAYPQALIKTDKGDITIELWNDVAPGHVDNFLKLTNDGFYNDLIFHRIISNFMIQGGCPSGTGTGGPGWTIDAEFNDREHVEGTLSMARSSDPNSAGSQFFVCLGREHCQHLDGSYTAFGQVVDGIEVVRVIGAVDTDHQDRPMEPIHIESVTAIEAE